MKTLRKYEGLKDVRSAGKFLDVHVVCLAVL